MAKNTPYKLIKYAHAFILIKLKYICLIWLFLNINSLILHSNVNYSFKMAEQIPQQLPQQVPPQVPQQVLDDGPHIVRPEDRAQSVLTVDSSLESYHSGQTTSTSKY